MGFSGSLVLCRSSVGFEELAAVWSRDQGLVWSKLLGDGWRIGQWLGSGFADDAPEMLAALVAETGRPAMTGYVVDSDCVDVYGLGLATPRWRACLAREAMAGYLDEDEIELEQMFPDASTAAQQAAAWAREAQLVPDEEGLASLFARQEADLFAEDLFFDLVIHLGVPDS